MKALILGGAECVWRDLDVAEAMFGPEWWDLAIAVNDIGCHWPGRVDYWASLHPAKFRDWEEARRANGHPDGWKRAAKQGNSQNLGHIQVKHRLIGGSSGLFAVSVALHVGATKIVLCGVPMEPVPHFSESQVHVRGRPWRGADTHRRKWSQHAGDMVGVVKSMSMVWDARQKEWVPSFTRRLLGAPTPEWLESDDVKTA